jgi:Rad3-related DNA helicase
LDKFADEEAKRLDISTVYGVICKISQRFKENAKGFYEHRRVACLIAAQAVSSKKWATYVQVETGNGKTYIMLLACAYLQEEAGEDVVYVTRDEINLRQVENKCKLVGLKLMVTDYEELSLIVEAGKTFICDEYYA